MKLIFLALFPFIIFSQQSVEDELDSAFINAKKGIYWCLSNVDTGKSRIDKDLISGSRLYASVKIQREVDGIKIESRGFFNSTEVFVKVYRSDDFLEQEGYLKKDVPEKPPEKKKKKL